MFCLIIIFFYEFYMRCIFLILYKYIVLFFYFDIGFFKVSRFLKVININLGMLLDR